jgi:transposase
MQLQLYGKNIWVYHQPIDFRCSIDGLVGFISRELQQKAQDGIYIFYNRARDKVKCLSWHKNGFILLYKRLEAGKFYFNLNPKTRVIAIGVDELSWLLAGLEWQKMHNWRELNYDKFS